MGLQARALWKLTATLLLISFNELSAEGKGTKKQDEEEPTRVEKKLEELKEQASETGAQLSVYFTTDGSYSSLETRDAVNRIGGQAISLSAEVQVLFENEEIDEATREQLLAEMAARELAALGAPPTITNPPVAESASENSFMEASSDSDTGEQDVETPDEESASFDGEAQDAESSDSVLPETVDARGILPSSMESAPSVSALQPTLPAQPTSNFHPSSGSAAVLDKLMAVARAEPQKVVTDMGMGRLVFPQTAGSAPGERTTSDQVQSTSRGKKTSPRLKNQKSEARLADSARKIAPARKHSEQPDFVAANEIAGEMGDYVAREASMPTVLRASAPEAGTRTEALSLLWLVFAAISAAILKKNRKGKTEEDFR